MSDKKKSQRIMGLYCVLSLHSFPISKTFSASFTMAFFTRFPSWDFFAVLPIVFSALRQSNGLTLQIFQGLSFSLIFKGISLHFFSSNDFTLTAFLKGSRCQFPSDLTRNFLSALIAFFQRFSQIFQKPLLHYSKHFMDCVTVLSF